MTDIVAFLNARLDEDEQIARDAGFGLFDRWQPTGHDGGADRGRTVHVDLESAAQAPITSGKALDQRDAAHIARHDPARVLREVKAKRALLGKHREGDRREYGDRLCDGCTDLWPCDTTLTIAAVYDNHPDYDPAWAE